MKISTAGEKEVQFKAIYLETFEKLNRILLSSLKNESLVYDALQEAYLQLWLKWEQQSSEADHYPFLYFYARNYALKQIARDIKRELIQNDIYRGTESSNLERELDRKEWRLQLSQVINKLPARRREIYRLFKEEGMSYQSIGEKLHISSKTVDSQLAKAVKTIRKEISSVYCLPKLGGIGYFLSIFWSR